MVLSFIAGMVIMFQAPINARLGMALGSPLWATLFSFIIGAIGLGLMLLVTREPLIMATVAQTETWMWIGGLLGACFVATTILVVPQLGAALMIALIVMGQMLTSLALDHTGFLVSQHPLNWGRAAGAAFIIIGVLLIKKY